MAELKFLRGSYTGWTALTKDPDSFYIVEEQKEQDVKFSLYLGETFLCDGVSEADLADAVKALENADKALADRVLALEGLIGGEGTSSVADQIKAAIEALDAEKEGTSADGFVTVKVTEVDGKLDTVVVSTSDIASASATTAAIEALDDRLVVIEGEGEGSIKKAVADAKTAIEGELAETDAKTLAALNNRIDTVVADAKSYSIAAVTGNELAGLGANVKEAFMLVDEDNLRVGEYIKVYKDSSLQKVELVEQELQFTYLLTNGDTSTVGVDVSNFLAESEFKNGLEVVDHVVSVKVDSASESFLTVGEDGVKLAGVQAAIEAAVSAETTARKTAIEALDAEVTSADGTHVTVKVTEVDGVITAVNVTESDIASAQALADEVTARTAAIEALDAEVTSADGTHVTVKVTEVDGVITAVNVTESDIASASATTAAIAAEKTAREEAAAAEATRVNEAIAAEASARTTADEALDGRLDALEAVKVTGKDAIEVSASGATESKEVSLKLATQPAEGEAGIVLSQDADGLKATLQWGTF